MRQFKKCPSPPAMQKVIADMLKYTRRNEQRWGYRGLSLVKVGDPASFYVLDLTLSM